MYKIYFDSRIFKLTGNISECDSSSLNQSAHVSSAGEMAELIQYFYSNRQLNTFCVYHQDVDEAFEWFSSNFKIIEAAGGLVQNKKLDCLLIYRLGYWDLPKGKKEKGETPKITALREVEEECSLNQLVLQSPLGETYHTYLLKGRLCMKKTYWYHMLYNGYAEPAPQAEEGIERAIWAPVNELNNYLPLMYKSVADIIKNSSSLLQL